MDAVVLCGVQAAGKTTLYRDRFLETHVRISADLLRTRHREERFLALCLETRQPFVVDKTNPTPEERRPYVERARGAGFRVSAWIVEIAPRDALARNRRRDPDRRVPVSGLLGTSKRLVRPTPAEGFDEVWLARGDGLGGWSIVPIRDGPGAQRTRTDGPTAAEP
jgi:predicted kinase